jgi:hypothetical protein
MHASYRYRYPLTIPCRGLPEGAGPGATVDSDRDKNTDHGVGEVSGLLGMRPRCHPQRYGLTKSDADGTLIVIRVLSLHGTGGHPVESARS